MKLTITPTEPNDVYPHPTVTIETPGDDMTMSEFAALCRRAALAFGYHPTNVTEAFGEEE